MVRAVPFHSIPFQVLVTTLFRKRGWYACYVDQRLLQTEGWSSWPQWLAFTHTSFARHRFSKQGSCEGHQRERQNEEAWPIRKVRYKKKNCMVPPSRKKSKHSLDILRVKCPTTPTTTPFVMATEYRSASFRGSLLHCTTSPTVGSHISLYIWCPRMHDSLRSSSMIVHARGC